MRKADDAATAASNIKQKAAGDLALDAAQGAEDNKAATDALEEMGTQRPIAEAQQAVADEEKRKADDAATAAINIVQKEEGDLARLVEAVDRALRRAERRLGESTTELKSFEKPSAGAAKVTRERASELLPFRRLPCMPLLAVVCQLLSSFVFNVDNAGCCRALCIYPGLFHRQCRVHLASFRRSIFSHSRFWSLGRSTVVVARRTR